MNSSFTQLTEHEEEANSQVNQLREKTFNIELRELIAEISGAQINETDSEFLLPAESPQGAMAAESESGLFTRLKESRRARLNQREDFIKEDKKDSVLSATLTENEDLYQSELYQAIRYYLSMPDVNAIDDFMPFPALDNNKEIREQLAKLKKNFERLAKQKLLEDKYADIITEFWSGEDDYHGLLEKFSHISFFIEEYIGANSTVCLAYSVKSTCFRPIFYRGFDKRTITDLAFIPQEAIIQKLMINQMPYELALFSFKDDHFMRKKFSKEFWDEQGKLLFIPLASNYTELKPKNILIILYFIPFGGDMVNFRNFGVKRSFQSLFKIFFPIVDMVQENIREYEISESSPTHIVDEVFAYFNDRRSYHQYEIENVDDEFIVINFTLRANNIAEHSISLHYLLAKIQKFLSTASKILRHSFDKGHIILKGRDCANLEKIKFIMSGHNDPVTWKIKRFPEFGKNLFNYQ